jgi:sulfatase maturation enzyme AslB (radical SAM superfamily)
VTSDDYLARKLAGLCVYSMTCIRPLDGDTFWCAFHRHRVGYLRRVRNMSQWRRERANAASRRWRKKRAREHRCTKCWRVTARKYLCRLHTELFDQYNARRRKGIAA